MITDTIVRTVVPKLLSIPFERLALEKACYELGWKKSGIFFAIEDDLLMRAYFTSKDSNAGLYALRLPFSFWENWEPENYRDEVSYQKDKKDFYDNFDVIKNVLVDLLGEPIKKGKKANYDKETLQVNGWLLLYYHFVVWQVDERLVVLQQCEIEAKKGVEISLWILPQVKRDDLPPFPITVSHVYDSYC